MSVDMFTDHQVAYLKRPDLVVTRGLPGSGKSALEARREAEQDIQDIVRTFSKVEK